LSCGLVFRSTKEGAPRSAYIRRIDADIGGLPDGKIEQLNALSRRRKLSRAELVRQAVCSFLALNKPGLEDSFGLWKGRDPDGVQYQESLRREW
jgi:hypothetical protein